MLLQKDSGLLGTKTERFRRTPLDVASKRPEIRSKLLEILNQVDPDNPLLSQERLANRTVFGSLVSSVIGFFFNKQAPVPVFEVGKTERKVKTL